MKIYTHANRSISTPWAGCLLTGFGIYQNYYKTALDKLQVQFHVFRVGSYKSTLESFMRNDMSDFDREASSALLDVLWAAYKNAVSGQRGVNPASVDEYVNHYPNRLAAFHGDTAQMALSYGLVDELKTADQVQEELVELAGEDPSKRSHHQVRFDEYLKTARPSARKGRGAGPKVAVIESIILRIILIFFLKPLDPSCGVHKFLLSSKEGMAVGADLDTDFVLGAFRFKGPTAGTFYDRTINLGVNVLFHDFGLQILIIQKFLKISTLLSVFY